jgi:hypothetical protein
MDIKDDPTHIAQRLAELRLEHRGLDEAIAKLVADPDTEDLQIRRLKKRKLKLKDTISVLESKLIPDLDA